MKKKMVLVMVLAAIMVTVFGHKYATENVQHTNEEIISTYLQEERNVTGIDEIKISCPERGEHLDEDFVNYLALDKNGAILAGGGIDLSYAEHTYCK